MDHKEKRKYPRVAVQLGVRFKNADDKDSKVLKEITNSIGQGGLFIRTKTGYPKETRLQVELSLRDKLVRAMGVVRYLIPYDKEAGGVQFPGMGVQFTSISLQDQEFIGKYVDGELKKQRTI